MRQVRAEPDRFFCSFRMRPAFTVSRLNPGSGHISGDDNLRCHFLTKKHSHTGNRVSGCHTWRSTQSYCQQHDCQKSLKQLSFWYPDAKKIYLVWDNWPVHKHPQIQKVLAQQPRVQVLWLPTYAPWLNPIEKLWRWTKQKVTHVHLWGDGFNEYKNHINSALNSLVPGSEELLRYVGLST